MLKGLAWREGQGAGERDRAWLGWSVAYLALQTATPFVVVPLGWVWVGTLISTLALMATLLGLVFALARLCEVHRWLALALLMGGASAFALWLLLPTLLGLSAHQRVSPLIAVPYRALHGYLLMLSAIGLGCLLSRIIRERNLLVPVVPFAALIDALTVLTPVGFVKRVMETAPAVLERAAVAILASPGLATPAVKRVVPIALVGAGDFVFLALYAACLYRFGLRPFATAVGLFLTLWAYLVLVMVGVTPALPALVPMAVVILAVNWRAFQLSRQEKWASLLVLLPTAALLLYLLWRF